MKQLKLRLSLKAYFFTITLFLVTCLSMGYSVLAGAYLGKGLDVSTTGILRQVVEQGAIPDQYPSRWLDFYLTETWDEQPEFIKSRFPTPPERPFELQKTIEGFSLFTPPQDVYVALLAEKRNGQRIYISRHMAPPPPPKGGERPPGGPTRHLAYIALFLLIGVSVFACLLFLFMRVVGGPVGQLKEWASSLTISKIKEQRPDFCFHELNVLAGLIQESLEKSHDALEREKEFLNYASHELRTPIAVFRSNGDLLMKVLEREQVEKEFLLPVVERMRRSSTTMSDLTDTLLWLGRDEDTVTSDDPVQIDEVIQELVSELNYLLRGKTVEVELALTPYQAQLPYMPCRITLGNLVRNAFQHTLWGNIKITLEQGVVTIINTNSSKFNEKELGFGLGLKLVEKLVNRYGWRYQVSANEDESLHIASISFTQSDP